MDWSSFYNYLHTFFNDPRVLALLGLIFLDVILGVAEALRKGEFEWKKLAQFYQTMVLPYLLGYLGIVIASEFICANLLGSAAWLVDEVFVTLAWATLITTLVSSVVAHLKGLNYTVPE